MKKISIAFLVCASSFVNLAFAQTQSTGYDLCLTRVAAAEAFLQLNKISTGRRYLDQCDSSFRGLEWRFLDACLDESSRSYNPFNSRGIPVIQLSPDGTLLAVATPDSSIILFSYPSMDKKLELKGHSSSVSTLAFSSDSQRLLSGGRDHIVILWNVKTGEAIFRNSESFSKGIYQVRFSQDEKLIGVVSWEMQSKTPPVQGYVKILDALTGTELVKIETDNHPASGVVFMNDNQHIIVSTWGEIVYCFNLESGLATWKYDLSDPEEYNSFHSIDLSPDGKFLALGSTDHRVHILKSDNGEIIKKIEPWQGHSKTVKAVNFSPDSKWLATAGEDQTILIWKVDGFSRVFGLAGHINTVTGICWTKDGEKILSASLDGTLKEWNLMQPFDYSYNVCDYGPWQVPVTEDGRYFAAPCSDDRLVIFEAKSGKESTFLGQLSGLCADFSKDSRWLVTASFDGIVRLWDVREGKEARSFSGHTGRVDGIAYLDAENQILSVGDTTLRVWSEDASIPAKVIGLGGSPFRIVSDPGGSKVYIGMGNGEIRVISTLDWSIMNTMRCNKGIQEMAISDSGKMLAVFTGKDIEIWDLVSNTKKFVLTGHEMLGYGLGFSPDEKYLVSGSYDQTFKFWDLQREVATLTFHGFEEIIYSCKFLSMNELLLGTSQGKMMHYRF